MEYNITPVKRRSLIRRLAPWTASLGLFAGGGFGVYHYVHPQWFAGDDSTVAAGAVDDVASANSDDPTVDVVVAPNGGLLSGMAASETTTPNAYGSAYAAPVGRYGAPPALPPAANYQDEDDQEVATPRSAAAVDAPSNPFAAAPAAATNYGYGANRYGAVATPRGSYEAPPADDVTGADARAEGEEPADVAVETTTEDYEDAADDAEAVDVARGQEPSNVNPLRAGGSTTAAAIATAADADPSRAAFAPTPTPADPTGYSAPTNAHSAGEPSAVPAPEHSTLTAFDNDRYRTPGSESADEPAAAYAPEPAVANDSVAAAIPTGGASAVPGFANAGADDQALPGNHVIAADAAPASMADSSADDGMYRPANSTALPTSTAEGTGRPGERSLEGLQSPALSVQKFAPPEIQVGKHATFQVRIQNTGQRTAYNVQVLDEVPLGTQLVGTAPTAEASGSHVVWDLGTLGPGEERIVEMELMPTAEGEIGSVATVAFAAQASAKARSTRPQLALRLSTNPRVMIGDEQVIVVEVSNPGTGDATGVMLLENIPQGMVHEAGPALEFEVGTLRPGETKRLELVLNAAEAGLVDNMMTAKADANLQVQANCQFEVIAPELRVSVDGPTRRILERPATYKVTVDNPGTASARDVLLVTQLPRGLQFESADHYGEYDPATHSVFWSLAELPANEHGTVELTALAVESGEHTLQFATRAQQGLEDRAEMKVAVEGIVALTFEVQDLSDAIEVGGETTYEIRVENQGTKAATNVQIVAAMPPGLRAQPGQGESRYTVQGDRVVFAPLAQLAPKSDATFRFRVQGLRPGDQRVRLQVTTDEVRDPLTEVESTQVYADE